MSGLYGRPTAAELIAAVADFLDNDVRGATDAAQVNFHARVAANVLRIVERELLDGSANDVAAALGGLGYTDEAQLAIAIRAGDLDDRRDEVLSCLRTIVRRRLEVAHPGYADT
jgi:AcrR family transcriptional regulator